MDTLTPEDVAVRVEILRLAVEAHTESIDECLAGIVALNNALADIGAHLKDLSNTLQFITATDKGDPPVH